MRGLCKQVGHVLVAFVLAVLVDMESEAMSKAMLRNPASQLCVLVDV